MWYGFKSSFKNPTLHEKTLVLELLAIENQIKGFLWNYLFYFFNAMFWDLCYTIKDIFKQKRCLSLVY